MKHCLCILICLMLLLLAGCSRPCAHTNSLVQGEIAAACLENGATGKQVCLDCGAVLLEDRQIPALGHDIVYEGCVEATCTESGASGVKKCSRCGEIFAQSALIEPLGHQAELRNAVQATCRENGYTGDRVCCYCGVVMEQGSVIPAGAHVPVSDNAVAATCTKDGYSGDTHCSVCGIALETGKATPTAEHRVKAENAVAATCTQPGFTGKQICLDCGTLVTEGEEIPPAGHLHTQIRNARQATTEAEGYTGDTYCTDCGQLVSYGEQTPQLTPVPASGSSVEQALFNGVNQARQNAGLPGLGWGSSGYSAALIRAKEHAANYAAGMSREAHTRPDGSEFSTVFAETGFTTWSVCGENLAVASDYNLIVNAWLESPGHRGNIMDADFTRSAMAVVYSDGMYFASNLFWS